MKWKMLVVLLLMLWAPTVSQAVEFADRVRETTTTTGTGTVNLAGAISNYRTFVAGIGNGNDAYYCIVHRTVAQWECGIGTVTDATPDTLSRNSVLSSSTGSAVSFSAGTKDVFATTPAIFFSKAVRATTALTNNVVPKANGDASVIDSCISDNGTTVTIDPACTGGISTPSLTLSGSGPWTFSGPVSLGTSYLSTTKTAGSTGVTASLLAKLDSSGNVVTAATSDVSVLGVAVATAASTVAVEVATRGIVNCIADNTTVVGNLLIPGTTTAGRCRDSGQTLATAISGSTQILGRALTAVSAASAVSVQFFGPGHYGASSAGAATVTTWAGYPGASNATGITVNSLTSRVSTRFTLPYNITMNQLALYFLSAATPGTMKVCLYPEDGSSLLLDATITPVNVTVVAASASGVSLTPGGYILVLGCATTCSVTVAQTAAESSGVLFGANGLSKPFWHGTSTHTSGTCNSTMPTITGANQGFVQFLINN